jgi:hypothetical protein
VSETELREALAKIEDWCIDSLDDIDAKHGSIQRLVLAVIPTTAANALASIAVEPVAPLTLLDAAYRERNSVVAALIRTNGWPTWIVPAPDADGWWIVYAETPEGQVSWHFGEADRELFADWSTVAPRDWDGHTTDEKYARLARLALDAPPGE